jgi:putative hydrolase of the HAD superfamily
VDVVRVKLVTFDAGQTLLRAHPSLGMIYVQVTREFGVEISPERFEAAMVESYRRIAPLQRDGRDEGDRRMWGQITREIHSALAPMREVPFDLWFERLYDRFGMAESWRLFEDTAGALGRLEREGLILGLISNWDSRLRNIVAELGVLDRFRIVRISAEAGERKPHPLMFRQAQEEAGVRPEEALHVGDSLEEDVAGALAAGWNAALLDRPGRHAAVPPGCRRLRSLDELVS